MQVRTVQRHQIGGWGFSLILHGILLSAIIPSFRHIPTPIQLEPFQWNVTFVESPQQTSPLEPDRYASAPEESLRTSKTESHNSVSSPTSPLKPSHHIRKGSTHVVEESGSREPLLAAQPPTPIAQLRPEISSPTPSATQTTSIPQETLAGEQPNTNGTAVPVSRESPAQPETSIDQAIQSPPASAAEETAMAPARPWIHHLSLPRACFLYGFRATLCATNRFELVATGCVSSFGRTETAVATISRRFTQIQSSGQSRRIQYGRVDRGRSGEEFRIESDRSGSHDTGTARISDAARSYLGASTDRDAHTYHLFA